MSAKDQRDAFVAGAEWYRQRRPDAVMRFDVVDPEAEAARRYPDETPAPPAGPKEMAQSEKNFRALLKSWEGDPDFEREKTELAADVASVPPEAARRLRRCACGWVETEYQHEHAWSGPNCGPVVEESAQGGGA